jgi:hypothetical protein
MGAWGNRHRRALTLTLGLALVALLAIPASSAASTKSKNIILTGGSQLGTLTVKCNHGTRATGGGFSGPPAGIGVGVNFYESRKVGQRRWRVSAQNGSSSSLVTAYAYCSKDAPETKIKQASASPAANAVAYGSSEARCGKAGRAQAGGFRFVPDFGNGLTDSFRTSKKAWRTRILDETLAPPAFTSYVYCADAKAPKARSDSTSSNIEANSTTVSAPCKHGTDVVAGGFSQPDASLTPFSEYDHFFESLGSGKRWRVSGNHLGFSSTTLTSIAYCA